MILTSEDTELFQFWDALAMELLEHQNFHIGIEGETSTPCLAAIASLSLEEKLGKS